MIRDLNQSDSSFAICDAKVCIVGAGTAGIYLAHILCKLGIQVVLLETGNTLACKPEFSDHICEQRGLRYRGSDLGRSFGLGGTSVLWGGQMIPLTESDIGPRLHIGFEGWPIGYADIAKYFSLVQQEFGLDKYGTSSHLESARCLQENFPDLNNFSDDFDLRLSKWLPFKKRNFAKNFAHELANNDGLTVWLNASVVSMNSSTQGIDNVISSIVAQSPNGRKLSVNPSRVVICAGALESTRLLLAFDEATDGSITNAGAPLGRYFADHLSLTCGHFVCRDWRRFNLALAPIFNKGVMQTPRLEIKGLTQQKLKLTSAFAHFAFVTRGNTGFDIVRNVLRRRQGEKASLGLNAASLLEVVKDLSAMVFWRIVHRRLLIPRKADLLFQIDIEQMPNINSRLILSEDLDALNRKRLAIDWQIKAEDLQVIHKVAELVRVAWQNSSLREVADLELVLPDALDSFATAYDVYHPTGSIRMGASSTNSVVDRDLRVWGTSNCYVSSTAVFPSAGSANPGLMHLALTARLADFLAQSLHIRGVNIP